MPPRRRFSGLYASPPCKNVRQARSSGTFLERMDVNRKFQWLAQWAQTRFGNQSPFTIPPLIQPVVDASCNWPLPILIDKRAGTLDVGANQFEYRPQAEGTVIAALAAYPRDNRYHGTVVAMSIELSTSLAITLDLRENSTATGRLNRLFAGSAANAWPFNQDGLARQYLQEPWYLNLNVTGVSGAETYTIQTAMWVLPESDPMPTGPFR